LFSRWAIIVSQNKKEKIIYEYQETYVQQEESIQAKMFLSNN